jgi:hypothetical protein
MNFALRFNNFIWGIFGCESCPEPQTKLRRKKKATTRPTPDQQQQGIASEPRGPAGARREVLIHKAKPGRCQAHERGAFQMGRSGLCPISLCGSSITLILVPLLNSTSVWSSTLSIFVTNSTFM